MRILNMAQSPLIESVRAVLAANAFETWYRPPSEPAGAARLAIKGHGVAQTFVVIDEEAALALPGVSWIGSPTISEPQRMIATAVASWRDPDDVPLLFVADRIDDGLADALWQRSISCLDSRGLGYLRFSDLVYELGLSLSSMATTSRPRLSANMRGPKPSPGAALTPAGLGVSLLILMMPAQLDEPLRNIANVVPASLGTVQAAVRDLKRSGYADEPSGLLEPRRLLEDWTSSYLKNYAKWHVEQAYETDLTSSELRERLVSLDVGVPMWLSGEAAAEHVGLNIRPTTSLVYTEERNLMRVRRYLKLRRAESGPVSLAPPLWTHATAPPPLAPSPVIRADLLAQRDSRLDEVVKELEQRDPVLRRILDHG
ncbi:type IV toxin-antitoxin system AbiEi family antitoxin [Phycicoccus flavus]|uniref:type IV toxin-antitoxin system AbiEi family antitoxin n=1 Tax=Phycicoccus flavus TaxID=2502783 RepID=UPI000FEB7377|nr:type IV toxin-antitoxin system AbiEi family antitoxin [Phycicoccus flavus]NHA69575.1 hypothetical protein [Phycicoccus flavus]